MRNKVQLIGRVGQDPEIKLFKDKKRASFSLAINELYYDDKGDKVETTHWHNITVWGNQADFVEKFVGKGRELGIEGKLVNRSFEDKEGTKRYITEVAVSEFLLIGGVR
jgi:single-strand DNA-binding protein